MTAVTSDDGRSDRPRAIHETTQASSPALVHGVWASAFPWLVQGTTCGGADDVSLDYGLFTGATPVERVRSNWAELIRATGMRAAAHARQVHGRRAREHHAGASGLRVVDTCDAHVTGASGVLLGVTTADCVPVFLVDSDARRVGVAHAGWRGIAAGVLEEALSLLAAPTDHLHVHLGPAICGRCYEVGPEVFAALDQALPNGPRPVDLRAVLAERAIAAGVSSANITVSDHCTRCTSSGLFSHRGGDRQRQVGYVGIRG